MWKRILAGICTIGITEIIKVAAKARRKKREQVARLKREEMRLKAKLKASTR